MLRPVPLFHSLQPSPILHVEKKQRAIRQSVQKMTIPKIHNALHFSGSMLVRMSIKLSRPQRYPSSLLPSTHGLRWSRVRGGGMGTVFPKSIIQIPALPVRSWTNNKELPTTYRKTQQDRPYQSLYFTSAVQNEEQQNEDASHLMGFEEIRFFQHSLQFLQPLLVASL